MHRILVINGPNLNLLGVRRPDIYGVTTLAEIEGLCRSHAASRGCEIAFCQSNHEGKLIDVLHEAMGAFDGVVMNPGGYAHTSVALRDAVEAIGVPVIEIHLSDIRAREAFRQVSLIETVATGFVCGMGPQGYLQAINLLVEHLNAS
jgi:3-dehydroquinate dehydratase II